MGSSHDFCAEIHDERACGNCADTKVKSERRLTSKGPVATYRCSHNSYPCSVEKAWSKDRREKAEGCKHYESLV